MDMKRDKKILTDVHTHTSCSPDGTNSMQEMVETACEQGVSYYGVSDHANYDIVLGCDKETLKTWSDFEFLTTDEETYFALGGELKEKYAEKLNLLIGIECGYSPLKQVESKYLKIITKYQPDFVVNSVHMNGTNDYYFANSFYKDGELLEKGVSYREYFKLVRDSLDVPYYYDTVGHFGYCARYAPYEDKEISVAEFEKEIDDILTTIIKNGKILEVNGSSNGLKGVSVPNREILERYFFLGGREVCYASDAHTTDKIMQNREEVIKMLKEIGFTYLTIPCRGEKIKVEI